MGDQIVLEHGRAEIVAITMQEDSTPDAPSQFQCIETVESEHEGEHQHANLGVNVYRSSFQDGADQVMQMG